MLNDHTGEEGIHIPDTSEIPDLASVRNFSMFIQGLVVCVCFSACCGTLVLFGVLGRPAFCFFGGVWTGLLNSILVFFCLGL